MSIEKVSEMKYVVFIAILIAATVGGYVFVTDLQQGQTDSDTHVHDGDGHEAEPTRPRPSDTGPFPKVVFDEKTYDFGSMQVDTEMEHVFTLRNEGEAPLKLLAGKSTCKCTKFELSTRELDVGEEAELTVRWHGKALDPEFKHGGPVYTDDPENTTLKFFVTGSVDTPYTIEPGGTWDAGKYKEGAPLVYYGAVVSKAHEELNIDPVADSPYVTVDVNEMTPNELKNFHNVPADDIKRCGYFLKVNISPDIPVGYFKTDLKIDVDCLDRPTVVQVTATKDGPLKIFAEPGVLWVPSAHGLKLGHFPAAKGRSVDLIVLVNKDGMEGPLELTKVECTPRFLTAELTPESVGGDQSKDKYRLKIQVPPGKPIKTYTGAAPATIQLHTNHPSGQVLLVNVSYRSF